MVNFMGSGKNINEVFADIIKIMEGKGDRHTEEEMNAFEESFDNIPLSDEDEDFDIIDEAFEIIDLDDELDGDAYKMDNNRINPQHKPITKAEIIEKIKIINNGEALCEWYDYEDSIQETEDGRVLIPVHIFSTNKEGSIFGCSYEETGRKAGILGDQYDTLYYSREKHKFALYSAVWKAERKGKNLIIYENLS